MANPSSAAPGGKSAEFDEVRFFQHLRETADPSLLDFLRSVDKRTSFELISYLRFYLQRSLEQGFLAARRQRVVALRKALSSAIDALQKASKAYKELAGIENPDLGLLMRPGTPIWPASTPYFGNVLQAEEKKLTAVHEDTRKLFNEKRLGVSANHLWLVMLQEFILAWTERKLGKRRELRSDEIAKLIEATKLALGWNLAKSETDPELIHKAIGNFRRNKANAELISRITSRAHEQCGTLAGHP
jgi:hypothetical protein